MSETLSCRVLETCVYVDDLPRAVAFYRDVLGFEAMEHDARFCALNAGGRSVLILFLRGASTHPSPLPGGIIPPHDAQGPAHVAFAITAENLPSWESRLHEHGIAIESQVRWPRGGTSIFFRDPDGHLLELATPGVWKIY